MTLKRYMSKQKRAQINKFDNTYIRSQLPLMLAIERRVCGCDYGGTSWTTLEEANGLVEMLKLDANTNLLDLGAGCGWPSLYMAKKSGCSVTLVDLPSTGLRIAQERAEKDGISTQISTIVADAAHLPFSDNSFDAISHSDLLCCLQRKTTVLASCRRVVGTGGCMAFTVIEVAPQLSSFKRQRAIENGPEFIESDMAMNDMLARTGWNIIKCEDISAQFGKSTERQIEADIASEEPLAALLGDKEYNQRMAGWKSKLAAIKDGLLQRNLYLTQPIS